MPLLPAVQISGKLQRNKVNFEGKEYSGPMMADANGLAIDFKVSERKGLKKLTMSRRQYVVLWADVIDYDVRYKAGVGGSAAGSNVDLIIRTAQREHSFHLAMNETTLRNLLEEAKSGALTTEV